MIDMKLFKERFEEIKQNITDRHMNVDLEEILMLQEKRGNLIREAEDLRYERNEQAKRMKQKLSDEDRKGLIEAGKQLKIRIADIERELADTEERYTELASRIPNFAHPDAPKGREEEDNKEISRCGDIPHFSFQPKDHMELASDLDLVDFDAGVKVTGTKFYFLKHEAAFLDLGLQRYALDILAAQGFTPMVTPDLAKQSVTAGIGFNPRGSESNIYALEEEDLCLVGTAEITLGGYHANEIIPPQRLPVKLAGISHCFRREAGAAGQYSKGLYRVHQFSKVEMFVITLPDESEAMHQELLAIEEEIFQGLEIPYRVVDTCTGDLGAPAYRKYDLEAWMPGRGEKGDWGEITSTSNCTDYQSRRLKVRTKIDGSTVHVHMLNGTALAVSRALIALMENHQRSDGSIRIPKKLVPYVGFSEIRR